MQSPGQNATFGYMTEERLTTVAFTGHRTYGAKPLRLCARRWGSCTPAASGPSSAAWPWASTSPPPKRSSRAAIPKQDRLFLPPRPFLLPRLLLQSFPLLRIPYPLFLLPRFPHRLLLPLHLPHLLFLRPWFLHRPFLPPRLRTRIFRTRRCPVCGWSP